MFISEQYEFQWSEQFWDAYVEYSWSVNYLKVQMWEML